MTTVGYVTRKQPVADQHRRELVAALLSRNAKLASVGNTDEQGRRRGGTFAQVTVDDPPLTGRACDDALLVQLLFQFLEIEPLEFVNLAAAACRSGEDEIREASYQVAEANMLAWTTRCLALRPGAEPAPPRTEFDKREDLAREEVARAAEALRRSLELALPTMSRPLFRALNALLGRVGCVHCDQADGHHAAFCEADRKREGVA